MHLLGFALGIEVKILFAPIAKRLQRKARLERPKYHISYITVVYTIKYIYFQFPSIDCFHTQQFS